ncbi:c-type cytochrome [Candidatus Methylopumilus turicensis]|uniref:Cytochrome c4 n=1 Tax=Candidatus Methylopumilus turicensis TaxID=1581680 RepID=A0A0B7ISE4_9PROT|nr:c-type cytochrome [Candidatus Methylopumilus turicensis]CEN55239.1 Cytochrome c4 [Candidatus Methylopumilus turicensis]
MKIGNVLAIVLVFVGFITTAQAAGNAAAGEKIVTGVCAACHGADGNSVITSNPRLAQQHPEYIAKQLANFKSGERKNAVMSGIAAGLSAEDMANVAAYFGAQKGKVGSAKSNVAGSLGEKIYRGGIASVGVPACASCHGATGAGIPVQFPRLSGQHAEYVVTQLKAFYAGERANDNAKVMRMIASKLSDAEMAAVADYIQGLH